MHKKDFHDNDFVEFLDTPYNRSQNLLVDTGKTMQPLKGIVCYEMATLGVLISVLPVLKLTEIAFLEQAPPYVYYFAHDIQVRKVLV